MDINNFLAYILGIIIGFVLLKYVSKSRIFYNLFSTLASRIVFIIFLSSITLYCTMQMSDVMFWFNICFVLIVILSFILKDWIFDILDLIEIFD